MPLPPTPSSLAFSRDRFAVRASRLALLSRKFRFYDDAGNRIAFVKLNDYRVLSSIDVLDGSGQQTILRIRERVSCWPVTYDLFDAPGGDKIGALQHRPWKSLFQEEWCILDGCDREVGRLRESSLIVAFLHHFLILVPIKYGFYASDNLFGTCRQNSNPLLPKITFRFTVGSAKLDRRVAPALAVLLLEYRKHDE
jgi:hypothetical protein